jgi:hypothetical protein
MIILKEWGPERKGLSNDTNGKQSDIYAILKFHKPITSNQGLALIQIEIDSTDSSIILKSS